ncbi:MCP four helix bundle domain-containing protein [Massilia pseudoviolaceinigra]|uniref:MCP four helix bundle domain-containing protein n=1 Tax=Massilia pseudoviolaceinigra TaxID=3057165 RepID=UPI0027966183|nr:MCP four helix bundle domain-containing protein [Massilia sp. CCM 9206]MDQ1922940.1 MCP four helix bundle domain-containing protein [Massilia sp. CCM 9206]
MKIAKYHIGTRLAFGFAVLLSMTLALAVVGMSSLGTVQASLQNVVQGSMLRMELLHQMSESVHIVARVARTLALLDDEAAKERESVKIVKAREAYDAAFTAFSANAVGAADKAFVAKLTELRESVRPLNNQFITLARANKQAEAIALLIARAAPATRLWQDALATHLDEQQKQVAADTTAASASYERARLLTLGLSALALVIGVVLAWRVRRSITAPINAAVLVAQTVAAGDLTSTIEGHDGDETGRLMPPHGAKVVTLHPVRRAAPSRPAARPLRVANARSGDPSWEQF